jgi:hypothetical protein
MTQEATATFHILGMHPYLSIEALYGPQALKRAVNHENVPL